MFAHPKIRYSLYWKRIRNRTRRMRRQMLYKYLRTLCQLLTYVQHVKLQHTRYTYAHDEETQYWCDNNTQQPAHACTRTYHANNIQCITLDQGPNDTAHKQKICEALNAAHKTERHGGINTDSKLQGGVPRNDTARKERPDPGPYNNEYNLFGGGSNDRDWLSLTHISQALELLQHTIHRYAINQPTLGSSHQVCSVETLQHILNTAAGGRPFNDGVEFPQVLFDTLSEGGPCNCSRRSCALESHLHWCKAKNSTLHRPTWMWVPTSRHHIIISVSNLYAREAYRA